MTKKTYNILKTITIILMVLGFFLPMMQIFVIVNETGTFSFVEFTDMFFNTNIYVTFLSYDFTVTALSVVLFGIIMFNITKNKYFLINMVWIFVIGISAYAPICMYLLLKYFAKDNLKN